MNKRLNFGEYTELLQRIDKIENLSKTNKIDLEGIIQTPASRVYRTQSDIQKLRTALDSSESVTNPTYYNLQQIYNEVVMDSEVTSSINIRKNYLLTREYDLVKDGMTDERSKEFFSKRWFTDFRSLVFDSNGYGYSLIKLGDIIDDELSCVTLVPRQNTNPKTRRILETPYQVNSGESIDDKAVKDWLILVSDSKDTHFQGLYSKIATYQILLKIAQGAFAEYAERFGSPNIIVKTGMYQTQYVNKVESYLKDFNRLGYGIFSNMDEVQLLESSGKSSDIYAALISEMKNNIRKIVLGSETMGNDNTWAGTSQVNKGISDMIAEGDTSFVEHIINDELIPRLINLGLKFLKGVKFKFDTSTKMDVKEEFAMMLQAVQLGYRIDASVFNEKFPSWKLQNPVQTAPIFPTQGNENPPEQNV